MKFASGVVALAVVLGLVAPSTRAAQDPRLVLPPAAISPEDAGLIAQYWVMLANGRFADADPGVGQLLSRYPRNVSVLALAIEADIARVGATAALRTYESWLGGRTVEEPGVLRRVARSFLYEWARQTTDGAARSEALEALAQDGDADAMNVIVALAQTNSEAGLRSAVHLKQPQAISQVVERMRTTRGEKLRDIDLLADSGSPQAVPPLVALLKDPEPQNREAAARALGNLGGPAAELGLRPVLDDPHGLVRLAAAGALFKLGNHAGINLLAEMAASESASFRRTAAILMQSEPDESWKSLVRSLLSATDPVIRLDAARLLAPYDAVTARSVLDELSSDSNMAIREETELVMARLPNATFVDLRAILRAGRPLARVRAASRVLEMTR